MDKSKEIKLVGKRLKYSLLLQGMVASQAWLEWADKTRESCQQVGRAAVYPMLKQEVLLDKLTRANERLRMIDEMEAEAKKADKLKVKWKELTGQEKI